MAEKKPSFEENFKILKTLAEELQENQISVDQLVPRVEKALAAFKVCQGVLKETESRLLEITAEFAPGNSDAAGSK